MSSIFWSTWWSKCIHVVDFISAKSTAPSLLCLLSITHILGTHHQLISIYSLDHIVFNDQQVYLIYDIWPCSEKYSFLSKVVVHLSMTLVFRISLRTMILAHPHQPRQWLSHYKTSKKDGSFFWTNLLMKTIKKAINMTPL